MLNKISEREVLVAQTSPVEIRSFSCHLVFILFSNHCIRYATKSESPYRLPCYLLCNNIENRHGLNLCFKACHLCLPYSLLL